jgi:hypothetical protein
MVRNFVLEAWRQLGHPANAFGTFTLMLGSSRLGHVPFHGIVDEDDKPEAVGAYQGGHTRHLEERLRQLKRVFPAYKRALLSFESGPNNPQR